jgi:type VI secretion system secreted protein VgrG
MLNVSGYITAAASGGTDLGQPISVLTVEPIVLRADVGTAFAVYQQQGIDQILQQELGGSGLLVSSPAMRRVDYEVRWQESTFAFVSRLLEREGFHYVIADNGTLVVGDGNDSFPAGPGLSYLGHFADPGPGQVALSSFRAGTALSPTGAAVAGWDYRSVGGGFNDAPVGEAGQASGPHALLSMQQRLTSSDEVAREAVVMLDRERSRRLTSTGTSNSPGLRAGRRLTVAGGAFGGSYVVTAVRHAAWATAGCFAYGNSFSAIPDTTTYRPPLRTPMPRIDGILSAEITNINDPDALGRVKVKFPGPGGSFESDWIRSTVPVSPSDSLFMPAADRCLVAREVMVAFVDGDPRMPTIVGRVHNSYYKGNDPRCPPAPLP